MDDDQQNPKTRDDQTQNISNTTTNPTQTTINTQQPSVIHELPLSKLKMKNKLSPFAPAFDVSHSPTINPYSGQYGISTLPAQVPPAQISTNINIAQEQSSIAPNAPSATTTVHHHQHQQPIHHTTYTADNDNSGGNDALLMVMVDNNNNSGGNRHSTHSSSRLSSNVTTVSDSRIRHPTEDELYHHQQYTYQNRSSENTNHSPSQKALHGSTNYIVRRTQQQTQLHGAHHHQQQQQGYEHIGSRSPVNATQQPQQQQSHVHQYNYTSNAEHYFTTEDQRARNHLSNTSPPGYGSTHDHHHRNNNRANTTSNTSSIAYAPQQQQRQMSAVHRSHTISSATTAAAVNGTSNGNRIGQQHGQQRIHHHQQQQQQQQQRIRHQNRSRIHPNGHHQQQQQQIMYHELQNSHHLNGSNVGRIQNGHRTNTATTIMISGGGGHTNTNTGGAIHISNGTKTREKISIKTYTKHRNAQPIGTTVAYKHPARHYGQPSANETDPKFTNPAEIASYQRWELLESAQRWLPGEGTFITWKKHRYLIGPPIHMGMNGHIHYCYKYPIPSQALKKMKQRNTNGGSGGGIGEDDEEIEDEDESGEKNDEVMEQPIVETLAAKIVPNTPAFAREIVILRALQKCENVTELYDVLESERTLISILELAQADVYNFFVGRGSIRHGWNLEKPAIREHFSKMVIKNVVQGLSQMHTNEYLHCDLKSLNILLYIYMTDHSNARGGVYIKAKLTDFGHSSHGKTRISEQLFSNGMARVGTAGHVAPELFVEGTKCTGMIDIWSLGIVMFSMLVPGRLLFGEYTDLPTLKRTYDRLNTMNPWGRDGRDRPSWWTDFERLSPEARDLILWMTRYDPNERPSCTQILEHPWFLLGQSNHRENYRPKLEWVDRLCQSTIAQE